MTQLIPQAKKGSSFPAGIDFLPLYLMKKFLKTWPKTKISFRFLPATHFSYTSWWQNTANNRHVNTASFEYATIFNNACNTSAALRLNPI
jgi:hypothetical protein